MQITNHGTLRQKLMKYCTVTNITLKIKKERKSKETAVDQTAARRLSYLKKVDYFGMTSEGILLKKGQK